MAEVLDENDAELELATLTMDGSLCSDLSSPGEVEPREYHGGDGASCAPLSTLGEIWQWRRESWASLVTGLAPRSALVLPGNRVHCEEGVQPRVHRESVPKTLFCHDLKGGYLEDRFVNGSGAHGEYRFFHWAGIDTFIYFSHHLLTVPPLSWINSGHLHGVPVLGTLITEGREGAKVWEDIFVDLPTTIRFADTLAAICRHYRFDGYLLNVENEISKENVPKLIRFVSELRASLLRMGLKQAQVIWYDSVTCKGKLDWQNELNRKNKCFFDLCDGIFLNYTWTKSHLERSLKTAGARCLDVYVGVDVFGRNCFGGGGFDSDKAVSMIRSVGLSVALFAASWTHERLDKRNFTYLEYLFWQKLWPYLYLHGPIKLPFSTSFCQGYGINIHKNGEVFSSGPWYNLRKQQYQPCTPSVLEQQRIYGAHVKNPGSTATDATVPSDLVAAGSGPPCIKDEDAFSVLTQLGQGQVAHENQDAFYGGSCLKIGGQGCYSMKRMLVCGFRSAGILVVSVATKITSPAVVTLPALNILMLVQDRDGCYRKHVLIGAEQGGDDAYANECAVHLHRPLLNEELAKCRSSAVEQCTQKQLSVEGSNGWEVRHFSVEVFGVVLEIGAEVTSPDEPVYLGWLAVSRQDGY
ncbi:Cytosolic endo-beta-N-acetylglucosaminidase [Frankliniella fusca]|uniref:Cytosolic endo-beta-N-acetylglucosaminidase n=1 Tax=Frankliniella fusca TaxID=407009 RepID=A0AAE1LA35_9NEOP|nr:Cytosolic endo-beta-N-acetylglucosaminidase [Frankliniella fusca]